jgi:predicted amidophosphoribosyltransferase
VTQRHLFAFDEDAARTLIYKLKRKNLSSLQRFLSREYADILASELSAGEGAVLLYPPRSRVGIQKYGFDQARVIALGVGKITGIPVMDIFERGVGSEQKTLSAADRSKNASSVYFLKENNDIYGRTAVIIDDVVTSGSTAARLCELAFCAGAERAIVISAAKTVLG